MKKKDYGVIIFVEGDTEVEFYKFLIKWLRKKYESKTSGPVTIKNLHGIGGFKRIALRYYLNNIKPKETEREYYIVLAYDTDVFEFTSRPPVDWYKVDKAFRRYGALNIIHIEQKSMIEDWFLLDKKGICKHLNLPLNTEIPSGKDANERIQRLFFKANKLYYKGHYTKRFLDELDMEHIYNQLKCELKPLVDLLFYN